MHALPLGSAAPYHSKLRQLHGPFYPDMKPLNQDNDLPRLMEGDPSQDGMTALAGRVSDLSGRPISRIR